MFKNKKTFFGVGKDGKKRKRGVIGEIEDGTKVTLLNPSGKGEKYSQELHTGKRLTNDLKKKKGEDGKPLGMTDTQKAWRSGYLQARKDSANAYNSKKKQ